MFSDDESRAFEAARQEVNAVDKQLATQLAAEDLLRRGKGGQRIAVDDQGNRHLILTKAHKLADRYPPSHAGPPLNIAKALKGLVTNDWKDADTERRAMGEATLGGGGYTVPAELSSLWLDLARSKSVCIAAGAGTVAMESMTLRIAEIVQDVTSSFRPENTPLNVSDAVDLRARLQGALTYASLKLISDSPIANDMIVASITGALALAMDRAMLSGNGVVDAATDNPTGLLVKNGVNELLAVGGLDDYDSYLDAMELIEAANLTPNAAVNSPRNNNVLRKPTTGIGSTDGTTTFNDKTKLSAPADYVALQRFVTTSMPDTSAIVGQFDQAVFGMREGLTIEATRTGGDGTFRNVQVAIRGIMRLDVGILRSRTFTRLLGIA
jgi:HK97 family phage major capsid protein